MLTKSWQFQLTTTIMTVNNCGLAVSDLPAVQGTQESWVACIKGLLTSLWHFLLHLHCAIASVWKFRNFWIWVYHYDLICYFGTLPASTVGFHRKKVVFIVSRERDIIHWSNWKYMLRLHNLLNLISLRVINVVITQFYILHFTFWFKSRFYDNYETVLPQCSVSRDVR